MSDLISRTDAIDAVAEEWLSEASAESPYVNDNDIDRYRELAEELFADIPSADAVSREKYEDIIKDYRKQYENMNNEIADLEAKLSADAEQTDKLENQPCLVERNYTTEGGGGEIYHPTRQQGEWLPIEETLPTYDGGEKTWLMGMKCSNCGKMFDLRVGYYFCPSCGAIMYKGGDDE